MTAVDFERLYPRAWIIGRADGSFQPVADFEPGALDATIMLVRDGNGDVADAVAWEDSRPGRWWTYSGTLDYIGEGELRRAWWGNRPARMVSTPAAYLDAIGSAFCILRWSADVDAILGPVCGVVCDTEALKAKLRRTLLEQAADRRRLLESAINAFPIAVASEQRRAA